MSAAALAAACATLLAAAMALAWRIALNTGKSGYIDAIWALASGGTAAFAAVAGEGPGARRLVVVALVAFWGLRLGTHLWRRAGHRDDPRYAALKREWGERTPMMLLRFVEIQALAACPLVLAAALAGARTQPFGTKDAVGVAVVVLALAGEALADWQMRAFKADPANRGKVCDRGLWGWSRHPNYFCEWLVWLGIATLAAGGWGWLGLLAPLVIYVLLVHVSGIPPLEAHMERSRPAAFAAYKARVSAFWPRPPR